MTTTTKQTIKKFLEPLGYYKKYGIILLVVGLLEGLWGFFHPRLYSNLVSFLTTSQQTGVFSEEALRTSLIYAGFIILFFVVDYFTRNTSTLFSQSTMKDIYKKYISKFFVIDNNHWEHIWTGKLIQITSTGVRSWVDLIRNISQNWIRIFISTIWSLIFISTMGIRYTIITISIMIVMIPILIVLVKQTKKHRKEEKDIHIARSRLSNKIFMTKFEILQNNKTQNEIDELDTLVDQSISIRKKINNWDFWTYGTPWFTVDVAWSVLMIATTYLITWWDISIAWFVGIRTALNSIKNNVYNLINQFQVWPDAWIDVEKLWDTFDHAPSIIWYDDGDNFVGKYGDITIKNLLFSYKEDDKKQDSQDNKNKINEEEEQDMYEGKNKLIFEDFSLDIKWWSKLALVWPSGWGKTTLVKLISWYLSPTWWVITVDWQELPNHDWSNKYVSLKSYYQHIWYLTQEPSVFDGTVLENLLYWLTNSYDIGTKREQLDQVTKDKIEKSIRMAQCDRVYELSSRFDTEIWERWIKLSWWQKQRLAIAKIMLKDPTIILLDEPTSALDSYNEEQVTIAMNNLFVGKTVIIVAHRLQTVKNADDIVYIEKGKILERWTHQELVKLGGAYYKMVELQSGF